MENNSLTPWQNKAPAPIPPSGDAVSILTDYAPTLREEDKRSLITALNHHNYAMAAGYIWRRSISKLRSKLAKLGMRFLGEMLNREDINDYSLPDSSLTDHDTIFLAEALGFVDGTGAMRMKHGFELVSHFDSDLAVEEMSSAEAAIVIRSCVQYVFGSEDSLTAINFTQFRERLSSQTIPQDDFAVNQLADSPQFFIRTTLRTLLAAAKIEESARLDHSLANLNTFLPVMWPKLTEEDKWSIGTTFAELSNIGSKPNATSGVRKALTKVRGFDYVPENLRSNSFKRAAQAVIATHYAFNNFYNEPEPVRQLAEMGSSIPIPALAECIRAYLCVYLGNRYNVCHSAASVALTELRGVSRDRWEHYLNKILPFDEDILSKLTIPKPTANWISLVESLEFTKLNLHPGWAAQLVISKRSDEIGRFAKLLIDNYRSIKPA